jgi:hypothetical protein
MAYPRPAEFQTSMDTVSRPHPGGDRRRCCTIHRRCLPDSEPPAPRHSSSCTWWGGGLYRSRHRSTLAHSILGATSTLILLPLARSLYVESVELSPRSLTVWNGPPPHPFSWTRRRMSRMMWATMTDLGLDHRWPDGGRFLLLAAPERRTGDRSERLAPLRARPQDR